MALQSQQRAARCRATLSLLDESIDADIEAISLKIEVLKEKPAAVPKRQPRRVSLPTSFPRREIRHEPDVA
jgi:transposase